MIKTVLVDDEKAAIESTSILISEFLDNIEVVDTASSVQSGINSIKKYSPDLVFLDVQMDDGTGFDLLDAFPENSFEVIFITAYSDYAIEALRRRACDYLVKPISVDDLKKSVDAVVDRYYLRNNQTRANEDMLNSIALPASKGMRVVQLDDIICFEAERSYTKICLAGEEMIISRNLKTFDDLLHHRPNFVRVHRSAIINIQHVHEISRADGGHVVLTNNRIIHLPAKGREILLKILQARGLITID